MFLYQFIRQPTKFKGFRGLFFKLVHAMNIQGLMIIFRAFRYDRRDQLTAETGHRVVLVVQSSGGGCDDRLQAYEGSMCQLRLHLYAAYCDLIRL